MIYEVGYSCTETSRFSFNLSTQSLSAAIRPLLNKRLPHKCHNEQQLATITHGGYRWPATLLRRPNFGRVVVVVTSGVVTNFTIRSHCSHAVVFLKLSWSGPSIIWWYWNFSVHIFTAMSVTLAHPRISYYKFYCGNFKPSL